MYPDKRTERVMRFVHGHPSHVFRWHSVSCPCEDCLDTDALVCYGPTGAPRYRFDVSGLEK